MFQVIVALLVPCPEVIDPPGVLHEYALIPVCVVYTCPAVLTQAVVGPAVIVGVGRGLMLTTTF